MQATVGGGFSKSRNRWRRIARAADGAHAAYDEQLTWHPCAYVNKCYGESTVGRSVTRSVNSFGGGSHEAKGVWPVVHFVYDDEVSGGCEALEAGAR